MANYPVFQAQRVFVRTRCHDECKGFGTVFEKKKLDFLVISTVAIDVTDIVNIIMNIVWG